MFRVVNVDRTMSVRERVVLIGSADERLQVLVIRTQVTVIW